MSLAYKGWVNMSINNDDKRVGWKKAKLGDVIELISGQHIASSDYNIEGNGIPYLTGPADFPVGKIITTKYTKKPKAVCKEGDILITVKGSGVGKLVIANREYCISRQLMAVRTPKKLRDFIYYSLQSREKDYNSDSAGLIPGLSRNDLLNDSIYLPDNDECEKIGSIIKIWDKAIGLKEKLIEHKKGQKRGLMQRLLTGELRMPGFDGEWEEIKLDQLGTFKTSSVDKKTNKEDIGVSLVNYMDVYRNNVIDENIDFMRVTATEKQIETFSVQYGDVLFTPSSETPDDIGHSAVVKMNSTKTLFSYHLVRLRFDREMDVDFKAYVFNSPMLLMEFTKRATGATRYTLSLSDFKESSIKIPKNIKEQKAIGTVLLNCDKEIKLLEQEVSVLKLQKKGLMQLLLTGKVRVQV